MKTAKQKPPYSKCGRLQLCSRCERYCSRYKNTCPTCDRRYEAQAKLLESLRPQFPKLIETRGSEKHLVGKIGPRGLFIIWTDRRILDRTVYREIAAEAKANGIEGPYLIYGRIATYSGPGMEFFQIGGTL